MHNVAEAITEIEIISQAQNGDRDAFSSLVLTYREAVINVVYRMCGEAVLSEDAAQIAFLKAWQNLHTYQPKASFRSWLFRIAINAALDILRREKPVVDIELLPIADQNNGPQKQVESRERGKLIQDAVLSLPEASRKVLILREYQGMSYREISETLEIPTGTVMSRLNYGRKRLVEILRPCLEEV
ncbi:MAG: sigma-70 family RNA polymerase sigma factor [Anaerolineaceae bacterium]|nr:sigma-70 family RNA polymerase sigma factor [Anaerolineaceae bacterium]